MAIAPAIKTTQALSPVSVTAARLQALALPAAVAGKIQDLRNLLYESAERDKYPPKCDFSKDPPDYIHMYGDEAECRMRHCRTDSEFRQGIHWMFQHNRQTGQDELSNAIVEPLIQMMKAECYMEEPRAREIVWDHYQRNYGHFPPPPAVTEPSRIPLPVTPTVKLPGTTAAPLPTPGLAPMPSPAPSPGVPGVEEGGPAPENGGLAPSETNGGLAPEQPEEFPWMWVGIGAGALVLIGGGIYLATRK